ncbi:ElyC/SanA/YdcF family protein [Neobacillus niacini]|uniref:ElyC/SanA/YdcF family protein n=1 Tax=Neobacillus niacini TaxID=86668 RepID=UPI0007ABA286|nr:ElyC/SanA/YdcF family protein [Neobacillus niacini]MEC1524512.1 ElyC/SanA/YdcF family protein [Neobacillus niacini]
MDLYKMTENINILSDFLGKRDIDTLTSKALEEKYQIPQTDLLILFGGSIAYGCDVVGKAISNHIAKNFMIVGGEGHTTETLRREIHSAYPELVTAGKTESEIMSDYIKRKYNIDNILLERNSTNCGNNITYALEVMKENNLYPNNIIIVQDSTMQCRMDAGFRKFLHDSKVKVINFASYKVRVEVKNEKIVFESSGIWGMWDLKSYLSLLMGEIPRLLDDANGYGPNGKNYIAHVNIPVKVLNAFEELKVEYQDLVRVANPLYASK